MPSADSDPLRKSQPPFGSIADSFFERGGAIESGQAPPPEEGTWMLNGKQQLVRRARRSLPMLIVGGVGFFFLLVLLTIKALT